MESCSCVHCTADDFHREQMKDDYMEERPQSIYSQLQELHGRLNSTQQMNEVAGIMDRLNSLDTYLIEIALTCEDKKTTEKILEVQYNLY
ncbi:hypothetical protein IEU_05591 [Bacillus mycoides]|nr:hypothetical protein IEU_05591 [Bacillus mycoides]